jgi:arginyl-tRNA synthetase
MYITDHLTQSIAAALNSLYSIGVDAESITLQETRREFKGDYTLVVFPYVKQARKAPEAVAQEVGAYVAANMPEVSGYNVVKGFLNFEVSDNYWTRFITATSTDERFGLVAPRSNEAPVVVEYSSPNTNKPLHLGHIRNNLLG